MTTVRFEYVRWKPLHKSDFFPDVLILQGWQWGSCHWASTLARCTLPPRNSISLIFRPLVRFFISCAGGSWKKRNAPNLVLSGSFVSFNPEEDQVHTSLEFCVENTTLMKAGVWALKSTAGTGQWIQFQSRARKTVIFSPIAFNPDKLCNLCIELCPLKYYVAKFGQINFDCNIQMY